MNIFSAVAALFFVVSSVIWGKLCGDIIRRGGFEKPGVWFDFWMTLVMSVFTGVFAVLLVTGKIH